MIDPTNPDYTNTPVAPTRPLFDYAPIDPHAVAVVTIITPFYNTGVIFHETAQSVFQQSFQQWQWLIVNDASTDATALAVLDEYRQRDPRICVIDLPANSGPAAARNLAFREAQTEYVTQLDSDDLLEPTAIEKWLWFLESNPEYSFVKGYSVGFEGQEYLWQRGFENDQLLLEENYIDLTCLIRKSVHQAVGGFDETIRGGFEDWDFWLRCANAGYWGATIPEYLNWYRRRPAHNDRWHNWDTDERQRQFQSELRLRYPRLRAEGLPDVQPRPHNAYEVVSDVLPFENNLAHRPLRLLLIVPWLTMGGADKFNLDLLKLLVEHHGYEVTIATTLPGDHGWMASFAAYTSDIFPLSHFLRLSDYPRFLWYLIQSRQIETVLVSNSYLGYDLLPYLRAHCPHVSFMDYIHMEEEEWKSGGYPRASLIHAEQLDLTVVSSCHLKQWMVERGGDEQRIEVCTTNIDPDDWTPERYDRAALRHDLDVAEDMPVILYAGRLCAQKQPQLFAEVMRQLTQQQLRFVCLVAGDGPDRPFLEQFLQTHHLHNVRMLGRVSNERIRELLAVSDMFFLPSQMEGISLAIYEAMSMGVVPVGAVVGGQAELVTPDCGVLVQRGPTEGTAYVEALRRLLQDADSRIRMGQAARQRICDHYRLEQMGERMRNLIARASTLTTEQPRAAVSLSLGLNTAYHAIEQARLERLAEQLWAEREALLAQGPVRGNVKRYAVLWTGRRVKRVLRPAYRWAVQHGMGWLPRWRQRIEQRLVQR